MNVRHTCRVFGVSRSGYYASLRARPSPKCVQEGLRVRAAFTASGASYGSRRVMHALRAQGL